MKEAVDNPWSGMAPSCAYGVVLTDAEPVVVRAERRGRGVTCFTASLKDAALTGAAAGATWVAVAIPLRESFARSLQSPLKSLAKARKVLPSLLDIQLPFPLEECVHAIVGLRADGDGSAALAVGARQTDLRRCIDGAPVDPAIVEHEGVALWSQSLREKPVPPGAESMPRVVAYLGGERATLVVGRGPLFLAAHSVRAEDTAQIQRLLKAHLDTASDTGEKSPAPWFWAGPGAARESVVVGWRQRLGDERIGKSTVHDEPGTFLARALATRAVTGEGLAANLRQGEGAHPLVVAAMRRQATRAPLRWLAAGLLLCALNVGWILAVGWKEQRLDETFETTAVRLVQGGLGGARGQHALKKVQDRVRERSELLEPFAAVFSPSLGQRVKTLGALAAQSGLEIETLSLGPDKVQVSGTAGDWRQCEVLVGLLQSAGYGVRLERKEVLVEERVAFTILSAEGGR